MSEKRRPEIKLRAEVCGKTFRVELFPLAEFSGKIPVGERPRPGGSDRYRLRLNGRWYKSRRRKLIPIDDGASGGNAAAETGEDWEPVDSGEVVVGVDGRRYRVGLVETTWGFYTLSDVMAVLRASLANIRRKAGRSAKASRTSDKGRAASVERPDGSKDAEPAGGLVDGVRAPGARAEALLASWARGENDTSETIEA